MFSNTALLVFPIFEVFICGVEGEEGSKAQRSEAAVVQPDVKTR